MNRKKIHGFFIRKFFIRKWASKTPKPQENVKQISSLKCLGLKFWVLSKLQNWLNFDSFLSWLLMVEPFSVSVKPIKQTIKENKGIKVKKKLRKSLPNF